GARGRSSLMAPPWRRNGECIGCVLWHRRCVSLARKAARQASCAASTKPVPDEPAATSTPRAAGVLGAACPADGDNDQGDEELQPVTADMPVDQDEASG